MAIKIDFDSSHNAIPPTIVLATKSGKRLDKLPAINISVKDCMNDAANIAFDINKADATTEIWNALTDFKTIWVKEWNRFFEIYVEINESNDLQKNITAKSLGQAELSQINLYGLEINTKADIERDDYSPTVLYDPECVGTSLLHKLLEKAPHYRINHVDASISRIQRTFSFDKKTIKDAFDTISKEINCIFMYDCYLDDDGNIVREINVYDLEEYCITCGYRGEFDDKCPKCGNAFYLHGYGEDTNIFISSSNLADEIELSTDTDSVKNCFKLEAGDDLMTATVASCNPNGSSYIWFFSEKQKSNMSQSLAEKLAEYDYLYHYYQDEHETVLPSDIVARYNSIVDKYSRFSEDIKRTPDKVCGYPALMNLYYDTIDMNLFLSNGLMPSANIEESNARKEADKLTYEALSPVSVQDITKISETTATNAVLAMAKVVIDSVRYQVKAKDSSLNGTTWTGSFTVKSNSKEDDSADSPVISVEINDDYSTFIKQQLDKVLNKASSDSADVVFLFSLDEADFSNKIQEYSLSRLSGLHEAFQSGLNILIEQGISDNETLTALNNDLYSSIYEPLYNKLLRIEDEIKCRESEVAVVTGLFDENGELLSDGIQTIIIREKNAIQSSLNVAQYLGEELWLELSSFRREDCYQNSNFVSDGLDNTELFENAIEFFNVAKKEIIKAANLQHSISATLKNLLVMKEFRPIVEHFEVGNWIRISIDGIVYKLRLLDYQIQYDNLSNIAVKFSDVKSTKNVTSDLESVIKQSVSMATSYDYVARQAIKGEQGNKKLDNLLDGGVDISKIQIADKANNQNQSWDRNGLLFREYDPISEDYKDEQLKIINSTIAMTDDKWRTTKTAIGKFYYLDEKTRTLKQVWGLNGELIAGKMFIGEALGFYNKAGSLSFDDNGFIVTNGVNTVKIDPNDQSVFNIAGKIGNLLSFDEHGNLIIVGDITANSLTLSEGVSIGANKILGLSEVATSGEYSDLNNIPDLSGIEENAKNIEINSGKIRDNSTEISAIKEQNSSIESNIKSLEGEVSSIKEEISIWQTNFVSFELDTDGNLIMNSSDGLVTTDFSINDDGDLEVEI